MIRILMATLLLSVAHGSAQAAELWGINGEEKTRINVTVVDILCELSGDCPADCGGGKRQFGLKQADGTILLAIKNADPFAGTAADLAPFCSKQIQADGLLIKGEKITMFALQFKRELPDGEWSGAKWFSRDWAARNGKPANRWFEDDPTIQAELERNGILGLPGVIYDPN